MHFGVCGVENAVKGVGWVISGKRVGWGVKRRRKFEIAREVSSPWGDTFTIGGSNGHGLGLMKVWCPPLVVLEPVMRQIGHLRTHFQMSSQRGIVTSNCGNLFHTVINRTFGSFWWHSLCFRSGQGHMVCLERINESLIESGVFWK